MTVFVIIFRSAKLNNVTCLPDEKENWDGGDPILCFEELPDRKRKRQLENDEPQEEKEEGKSPRWDPVHISQIKSELQVSIQKTEKLKEADLGVSKLALEQLMEVLFFRVLILPIFPLLDLPARILL
jgi:hypothetical protein